MVNLKKKTNLFKGLRKKMPELNKETLKYFTTWWKKREVIRNILKARDLSIKEYEEYKKFNQEFLEFGNSHKKDYENNKIEWNIMENYLEKDIIFCDRGISMLNFIDVTQRGI